MILYYDRSRLDYARIDRLRKKPDAPEEKKDLLTYVLVAILIVVLILMFVFR